MLERALSWLLNLLRVPAEPVVPGGKLIRVFRAAPAYYRYKLALWAAGQLAALVGLIGGLIGIAFVLPYVTHPVGRFGLQAAEVIAWVAFLWQFPLSLAILHLDFSLRWYILSDRSLRIREGILTVQEKTMTFANIQQISIRQNPLQRLLGIADVQVRSAGGGSSSGGSSHRDVGESPHEAYFRGVDNAEEIKRAIQERVRLHRDAGLGDPDEPEPAVGEGPGALQAARAVLEEVRALRERLVPEPPR